MPVQVSYPGVYIQEVPSGVRTITGVSTSLALFIGMTPRGPFEEAVSLTSFADYERQFGNDRAVSEMTDQVSQFFLNGGRRAFVVRTAQGEEQASASLENESGTPVLDVEAAEPGSIGESIRLEINYDTPQPESTFNIVASREVLVGGQPVQQDVETLANLSMDPNGPRFVEMVLDQESSLIRATVAGTAPAPFAGYSISGNAVADILAELNARIAAVDPATNTGRFQISVDGSPPATVSLIQPLASLDAAAGVINNALPSGSVSVVAGAVGGLQVLLIVSDNANGGSVQVTSAAGNDIAGPLHLGTANDGLEVGGYAAARPAPTGLFATLGNLDSGAGTWLDALEALAQTDPATLPDITVTTTQGAVNVVETAPIAGFTRPTLWENNPAAGTSLRNLRESINAIEQQLTAAANFRWTPSVYGFRLILNPTFTSFAEQESADVTVAGGAATIGDDYLGLDSNVRRAPLGDFTTPSLYVVGGNAGEDGTVPQLIDYQRAFGIADRDIDLFNLMILPRVLSDSNGDGQTHVQRAALWGPASAFCREQRAFLLIDAPEVWADAPAAETGVAATRIGVVGDHAMQSWPRLRITDPATGLLRTIDPSGSVAGIAARIDGSRGVWKAPAGLEASVIGARGVEHRVSDAENGILNPQAINVVRQFPNGIVIWGSRTVAGFDNSGENDYKYVPVRRTALFIEESLYRGLQFAVFEPNDEPLWAEIRLAAGAFMNNLFRRGAFQGSTAREAYFVKCDAETTTQNDINLGIVNVVIGFAPLKPAEFVVITLRQLAGQVQT
jgi:Bacteriophage tail sheath protein